MYGHGRTQGVGSFGPAICMAALALNVDSTSGVEGDVIAHMPPQLAAALFVGSVSLGAASAGGFASSLLDIRCVCGPRLCLCIEMGW